MVRATLPGHAGEMPVDPSGLARGDAAELSSLTSIVSEVRGRVSAMTAHYLGTEREDVLGRLLEAERLVRAAERSLTEAARLLR
jgi:hypothetical protein